MTYTAADLKPIPQYEEIGIPLLRKLWEQIKADKRAWNQSTWIGTGAGHDYDLDEAVVEFIVKHKQPPWDCGTAYCVAGHTVLAKGARLTSRSIQDVAAGEGLCTGLVIDENGEHRDVSEYAQELLGLLDEQAELLFKSDNGADLIEMMIEELEADPAADLYDVYEQYYNN